MNNFNIQFTVRVKRISGPDTYVVSTGKVVSTKGLNVSTLGIMEATEQL